MSNLLPELARKTCNLDYENEINPYKANWKKKSQRMAQVNIR